MKKPRPTVVEKIQAQQAQTRIEQSDVRNLVVAARYGLQHLGGQDLVNVSLSIARVEAALAPPPAKAEQAPPPPEPQAG